MHNYGADKLSVDLVKDEQGYRLSSQISPVQLEADKLDELRKHLYQARNPELEDYYWQLAGETDSSSELNLVAMMSDELELELDGDCVSIRLLRKL